ncbi:unnamed protein product, partial [Prorocentrum cordatum]
MEKMDSHLGPLKAQHWRGSKKLKSRADSLTGSEQEEYGEWRVPEHWGSMTEDDPAKLSVENAGEATQGDVDNLDSEKGENKSELVKIQRELEDPKTDPRAQFDKCATVSIEGNTILANAEKNATAKTRAAALVADLAKHIPR